MLLRLAHFLISERHSSNQSQEQSRGSPHFTTLPERTRMAASQSSTVAQYLQSLQRKSPITSPLSKYRKLKHQRSPLRRHLSPLKRHHSSRKVVTRLFEPDKQPGVVKASVDTSSVTPVHPVLTSSSTQHSQTTPHTIQSSTAPIVSQSSIFSTGLKELGVSPSSVSPSSVSPGAQLARLTPDNHKKPSQKQHLVTVSKKSLDNSGSFTRLDLSDLFTVVNQNLKQAEKHSAGPVVNKNQLMVSEAQQASLAALRPPPLPVSPPVSQSCNLEGVMSSSSSLPVSSSVPSITGATPSSSSAPLTWGSAPQPSPLEQLASKVISQHHNHPPPRITAPQPIHHSDSSQM